MTGNVTPTRSGWSQLRLLRSLRAHVVLWLALTGGLLGCNSSPTQHFTDNTTDYTISQAEWDETAVRRVLHVFAYGGFATDAQIKKWAEMLPQAAINEIITLQPRNSLLSPVDYDHGGVPAGSGLREMAAFWASNDASNPVPVTLRESFDVSKNGRALDNAWCLAVRLRGLNPVRQKIGLLETNYHMAVNLDAGVSQGQIFTYYDELMAALSQHKPYQDVIALAALSAAVAQQFNHRENIFSEGRFLGNEDFAREFFQLYFGILGNYDSEYHEFTTIRNTAKALTDMKVEDHREHVTFGTAQHFPGALEILQLTVAGKTAREKIKALAQQAITHPESLNNLPVILVRFLADDNLDDEKIGMIREIWKGMEEKNLVTFFRRYAISRAFHHTSRVKYWSTISRKVLVSNLLTLTNQEAYRDIYPICGTLSWYYGIHLFRPTHDVFGHQTGIEAADTSDVFKLAYNRAFKWEFVRTEESDDNKQVVWRKDWARVIPRGGDGTRRVKAVTEYLWQRFIADGGKNLGVLERAHIYALLVSGKDLAVWLDKNQPTKIYTSSELGTDRVLMERIKDVEIAVLSKLDSSDEQQRKDANYRVGLAVAFITATPYMFAQEGK